MELLRDYKSLDDSTVVVSIKYLVHLVGDMHCRRMSNTPTSRASTSTSTAASSTTTASGTATCSTATCDGAAWNSSTSSTAAPSGRSRPSPPDRCATGSRLRRLLPANLRAAQPDQQFKSPDVWEDFLNPALPIAERQILYAGYRLRMCSTNCSDNSPISEIR